MATLGRVLSLAGASGAAVYLLDVRYSCNSKKQAAASESELQDTGPRITNELWRRIAIYKEEQGAPGVSFAVVQGQSHDDRAVLHGAVGYQDVETLTPCSAQTRFRIASISKPITTCCALVLAEQGKLDWDVDVRKYLPKYPEPRVKDKDDKTVAAAAAITPRLLAGHLAGVRHYKSTDEFYSKHQFKGVVDALKQFQDDPLHTQPGETYRYSSFGYNLLGAVVEAASGTPFTQFARDAVLGPLGVPEIVPEEHASVIPNRARQYQRSEQKGRCELVNAPLTNNSNKHPSGGFLATARDLAFFGHAMLSPPPSFPVSAQTLHATLWKELRATPRTDDDSDQTANRKTAPGTGYGLGWRIGKPVDSRLGQVMVSHGGGASGGSGVLAVFPEAGLSVAVLANLQNAQGLLQLAQELAATVVEQRVCSRAMD